MSTKVCSKCNIEKSFSEFHKDMYFSSGRKSACKTCINTQNRLWAANNPDKVKSKNFRNGRTIATRWHSLKKSAKQRNHDVVITLQQFEELVNQPCIYCDGYFPKTETGSNIDRLDNAKGYVPGNCVPCCGICNDTKGKLLNFHETKIVINRLIMEDRLKKVAA